MARFLIETRKAALTTIGKYKWSNRYFAEVADAGAALTLGASIWNGGESKFHNADAYCYEIYVNQQGDPPFSVGFTQAMPGGDQRGDLLASGQFLPHFNVVRVDFSVTASRPSRKFYRIPLREDQNENASPTSALLTALTTGCTFLSEIENIVDVDGQDWSGAFSIKGFTSRRLGKLAFVSVPDGPPVG